MYYGEVGSFSTGTLVWTLRRRGEGPCGGHVSASCISRSSTLPPEHPSPSAPLSHLAAIRKMGMKQKTSTPRSREPWRGESPYPAAVAANFEDRRRDSGKPCRGQKLRLILYSIATCICAQRASAKVANEKLKLREHAATPEPRPWIDFVPKLRELTGRLRERENPHRPFG